MSCQDLFNILLSGDLNPTLRAELPAALTSSRRGDSAPLMRLAARSAGHHRARQPGGGLGLQRLGLRRDDLRGGRVPVEPRGEHPRSVPSRRARSSGRWATRPSTPSSARASWRPTSSTSASAGRRRRPRPPPRCRCPPSRRSSSTVPPTCAPRWRTRARSRRSSRAPRSSRSRTPATRRSASDTTPESCALRGVAEFFAAPAGGAVRDDRQPVLADAGRPDAPRAAAGNRRREQDRPHDRPRRCGPRPTCAGRSSATRSRPAQLPRRLGGLRGGHATVSPSGTLTLTQGRLRPRRRGLRHGAAGRERRAAPSRRRAEGRARHARRHRPRRSPGGSAAGASTSSPAAPACGPSPPTRRTPRSCATSGLRHAG